ncbi:patatin-like phospholipase family protein [Otariodibacter sp.]|uniref:patatin-like phospholipase family protein n=1 Tax=Otariodibacter sp. TaxID=3030919 RepID=UPI00262D73B4|nr:patatin-like phospholipase family protein [Otariodibacter sp.]
MKIGLVLEGGAMRGMYTAGVLDVFMDNNIQIDGIIGVSAGALFGVNYLSKQRGRSLRYSKRFLNDERYISLKSWITTGNLINKDFAYYDVPFIYDVFDNETFKQSHASFYVTLTNVETGKAEYVKITDPFEQMEYFRATSALPYVSKIVQIDGKKYLDGGISDSIPLDKCRQLGFDKIIVVLTRAFEYRKTKINGIFRRIIYRKYPKFIEVLANRYQSYNDNVHKVVEAEKQGEIFVFRPSKTLPIKRIEKDLNKVQAMYDLGVQDAKRGIGALNTYLSRD